MSSCMIDIVETKLTRPRNILEMIRIIRVICSQSRCLCFVSLSNISQSCKSVIPISCFSPVTQRIQVHDSVSSERGHCQFSTSAQCHAGYKLKENIRDCFSLLGVEDGCSDEELREAYLNKVKIYHPDSQSSTADAKKFDQVKEVYIAIQEHRKDKPLIELLEDEDDDEEDKHQKKQAQHRQFLSYEGVGSGTVSQRQKQYEQYRVSKAVDSVHKYKFKRLEPTEENALVIKDKRAARRAKMTKSVDRLVEDLILKSMNEGDFKNLSGFGKPQDLSKKDRHHYLDRTTQRFNQILIDDDMLPDWILLEKEIREDLEKARERLAIVRQQMGAQPYPPRESNHWNKQIETFHTSIADINSKVNKYNLIVPILHKQKVHYSPEREMSRVLQDCTKYLPQDWDKMRTYETHVPEIQPGLGIEWRELWKNIKDVFKYRS